MKRSVRSSGCCSRKELFSVSKNERGSVSNSAGPGGGPGSAGRVYPAGSPPEKVGRRSGDRGGCALDRTLKDVLCAGGLAFGRSRRRPKSTDERTGLDRRSAGRHACEFIEGIPEWCISIALAENGKPIAAGICSPATGQIFLGSDEDGATKRKIDSGQRQKDLDGAKILASRSEVRRRNGADFQAPFEVIPMGSVAYKLACVSAGLADGTFTLVPKNEWDVAAGVLLVEAAGGQVVEKSNRKRLFNQPNTLLDGLFAGSPELLPN